MRVVVQRVREASVAVDGVEVSRIGTGLLALVGIAVGDDVSAAHRLAAKTCALRVFPDDGLPFHRSVADIGGQVLVVSQFTLLGDCRKGNRPSWIAAARPDDAAPLVDAYADAIAEAGVGVARGVFGADMAVGLLNDGPVTLLLEA